MVKTKTLKAPKLKIIKPVKMPKPEVLEAPVEEAQQQEAPPQLVQIDTGLGQMIHANMFGVDVVIRRPLGRVKPKVKAQKKAKEGEEQPVQKEAVRVEALTDSGEMAKIDAKKITKNGLIVDLPEYHEAWKKLDDLGTKAERLLRIFAVNDARRGFHLVPGGKIGKFVKEIAAIRKERLETAQWFSTPEQYGKYIAALRKAFDGHFHLIAETIPLPHELMEKFDIEWTIHPLTPVNVATLKFNDLNTDEQMEIVSQSNNMAQHMIKQRAKAIYEKVFGSVFCKCQEITKGGMETGYRKFGAIEDMVDALERLRNFSEFVDDPEVIKHADEALKVFNSITDINQINKNKGQNDLTKALKTVTAQLETSLGKFIDGTKNQASKAKRLVNV